MTFRLFRAKLQLEDSLTLGDVWGLLLESNEDVAGLVVESLGRVIVADVFDRVTDDLLVVDNGLRRDLAANEDHASLGDLNRVVKRLMLS